MERKAKQRICVDPQNLSWKEDKTSIGHRLLAKMGWSAGNGLGKSAVGSADNIKVAVKSDMCGLGTAEEETKAAWSNNAFETLLQGLNTQNEDKKSHGEKRKRKERKRAKKAAKVERKARRSAAKETAEAGPPALCEDEPQKKVRFYRQKFIQNKNVSQYSAEHLSEILGVK